MASADIEAIKKDLTQINDFVRERIDPVSRDVGLLKEETDRLRREVLDIQRRDRSLRRGALAADAAEGQPLEVPEGRYAGMDVLDLALVPAVRPLPEEGVLWPGVDRARRGGQAPSRRRP